MSTVTEVFRKVREVFIWQADEVTFGHRDHWESFEYQAWNGIPFLGDCDDFALTCLEVGLMHYDWDKDKCRIARVLTEVGDKSQPFDHAIAIYDGIILDNRQRGPVPITWPNYKFYDWCGVPITDWCLYENGQAFLKARRW